MVYNSNQIQEILPHRYPLLLVDRVEEMTENTIIAKKCISVNEMQFMGHFPQYHVMPGVFMIEALAQTGAILLLDKEEFRGKIAVLAGVNKMRFHRQVIPGDVLIMEVTFTKMKMGIGFADVVAKVDGEIACRGEIMFGVQ